MNTKIKNSQIQESLDEAYDYINILLEDDLQTAQEILRVIFEIFDHSTGKYNIYMPSKVKQWTIENRKVSEYEVGKFLNQHQYWNTSISGAIFHFWKLGFFKKTKLKHLRLDIPREFLKNIGTLYSELESNFKNLCYTHNFSNNIVREIEDLGLFKINPISLDNDFISYTGLEERIVHATFIAGDKYYLFILPIIKDNIYIGLSYFSIHSRQLCEKISTELEKVTKILERFVFLDIFEDMINMSISNEKWNKSFLQNRDIYNSSIALFNKAPIMPLVENEYDKDYTKYMSRHKLLCSGDRGSYPFDLWVPEWMASNSEHTDFIRSTLETHYLKPIEKLEQELKQAEANAIVRSDNQKERAIAHIQKRLYAKLSSYQKQVIGTFKTAKKEPPFLRPMSLVIEYVGLTDLVRQYKFKQFVFDSEINDQTISISLYSFLRGLYILCYMVLEADMRQDIDIDIYDYCSKIINCLKGETGKPTISRDELSEIFNNIPECKEAKEILKNLKCDERIEIKIPINKSMLYTLYGCFFEILSNHLSHSYVNGIKNICIFTYELESENGFIVSSCNCNDFNNILQCQYDAKSLILKDRKSPENYYNDKDKEDKFILKYIESQLEKQCKFYVSDIENIFSNIFVIHNKSELFKIIQ